MNTERMINDYCRAIEDHCATDDGPWEYTRHGVENIINEALIRKDSLIGLLSNHPNWDPENLRVVLDVDFPRDIDEYGCNRNGNYLINEAMEKNPEYKDTLRELGYELFYVYEQFIEKNHVDYLTRLIQSLPGCEKIRPAAGQKRAKLVRKIMVALGVDVDKRIDTEDMTPAKAYAAYCDAINPTTLPRKIVISVNPIDFLLSSHGNSWRSCHNPQKNAYSGCNCSGGISYSLDDTTICVFMLSKENNSEFMINKINRTMFHIEGEFRHYIKARTYPEGSSDQTTLKINEIFQKVLNVCLGQKIKWEDSHITSENRYRFVDVSYYATAYPDINTVSRNRIMGFFNPEFRGEILDHPIEIGAQPICIECGYHHDECDVINCCHRPDENICPECGRYVDAEDLVRNDYGEVIGCTHCCSYSDYDERWYPEDQVEYVREYHGTVSRDSLEYSGDFYFCDRCYEWHYFGASDYIETDDGEIMCPECFNDTHAVCPECGSIHRKSNMIEVETEAGDTKLLCEDCYHDWIAEHEMEVVA